MARKKCATCPKSHNGDVGAYRCLQRKMKADATAKPKDLSVAGRAAAQSSEAVGGTQ